MSVVESKAFRSAIRTVIQKGGSVNFESWHIWKEDDGSYTVGNVFQGEDNYPSEQIREAIESFESKIK